MLLFSSGIQLPTITTFPKITKPGLTGKTYDHKRPYTEVRLQYAAALAALSVTTNLKISALLLKSQILKTCN